MRKYFTDVNQELLKKHIESSILMIEDGETDVAMVEEYVDAHHGTNIPTIFYNMIEYKPTTKENEDGWWDEFIGVLQEVTEELEKVLEEIDTEQEYKEYFFYVDYTENGDLAMLVTKREV